MSPPWAVKVQDDAPLTVVAVLAGSAWFSHNGGPAVLLEPGSVMVVRDHSAYVLGHDPDQRPAYFIGVDQQCSGANGEELARSLGLGLRAWGNDPAGKDAMLVGTYRSSGEVGDLLLASLPPFLVANAEDSPLIGMLAQEVHKDGLAQASVLDRLLDLLLIDAIRSWSAEQPSAGSTWLTAERDDSVRQAIRLIHNSPEVPWTVGALALSVGTSRASLARRFTEHVGKPPMRYLNQWRLAKGADLLLDPKYTLTAVARRVGYASPFGFSAAFKKRYAASPQEYRRRAGAVQPAPEALAPVSPVANTLHKS